MIEVTNYFKEECTVCPYFSVDTHIWHDDYDHPLIVDVQCKHYDMCNFLRGEKYPLKAYVGSDGKVVRNE